ncbi:Imm7 family immunity protein [Streptomyces sp. NPDC048445]|uniref:Imm7 family immunity protein n=1 Tax=Streptomyces sp. NPDC048445 TaxID=3365553 RepID=UPI003716FFDD
MYEFHGWFGIAESPEESDIGSLDAGISELRAKIRNIDWTTGEIALKNAQRRVLPHYQRADESPPR